MEKTKRKTVKAYYLKYWYLILAAFVLLVTEALCDLQLPDYMKNIVNTLTDLNAADKTRTILYYGGIMLGYAAATTVCAVAVGYIAAILGSKASRDLRRDLFAQVSGFSAADVDRFTVSSLITRSTNDVTQIQNFSIMLVRMVMYAPVMAIGGIIKAVRLTADMSYLLWVIVAAVAVVLIAIAVLMAIVQPKFIRLQSLIDKINGVAREGLNGMLVVRAFNAEGREERRFDEVNRELTSVNLFTNRVMSALFPVINVAMNGVSVAVVWIASYFAQNVTDVAAMMAFMSYAVQIIMSFMVITMVFVLAPRSIVSAKRVGEVLNREPSVRDRENAAELVAPRGEIEFDNVSFAYEGAEENAIEGVSFRCAPGETTAIIGATGSGKSTIVKLIPRLYDATGGSVKLDGRDVSEYTLRSLREAIAFVPQKNLLFSGTVASNIKLSDEKARDGDERMKSAAEVAQATEFIVGRDGGYDGDIAQSGGNVSGGQKQRLAIARALYKTAPVLVFDDSFSALDFKTDAKLRAALKEYAANKNVIIVAQRVGTIMNADRIIVLDDGKVVGEGTHRELMKSCAVYADIARSQLSEEELENE